MVWPAILGAITGLGLGAASADSQRKANHEELDFLRESRAIGMEQAGTTYQRAVKDMRAAGLNPMLAYSQGGAPVAQSPGAPSLENVVGAGVSSAQQAGSMVGGFQQMAQSQATTEQIQAQTDKTKSETMSHDINTARAAAELSERQAIAKEKGVSANVAFRTQNAEETKRIADAVIKQLDSEHASKTFEDRVSGTKAERKLKELDVPRAEGEAEFWKKTGELSPWLKAILQIMSMGRGGR